MKVIKWYFVAFLCVISILAWGCSSGGDDGGRAGNSGTGGASGTGASGGTSGTVGGGGMGASGGGGSGGAVAKPFSCTGWTRMTDLPAEPFEPSAIWGSSDQDVYIVNNPYAVSKYDRIAHYDGTAWTMTLLPVASTVSAIWGSASNDVWAAGTYLFHRVDGGAWQVDTSFPSDSYPEVVWGANPNDVFVAARHDPDPNTVGFIIYRKNGGSWIVTTPSQQLVSGIVRMWGKSASDIYALGSPIASGCTPTSDPECQINAWHYDGSVWKDIALPADIDSLYDVHGAGNETWIVGSSWDGSKNHGVRLLTTDLVNWSRFNSQITEGDGLVWSPWEGALLVTGAVPTTTGKGVARLITLSQDSWTEEEFDPNGGYLAGIWSQPSSNQVWLLITSATDHGGKPAGIFRGTCQ